MKKFASFYKNKIFGVYFDPPMNFDVIYDQPPKTLVHSRRPKCKKTWQRAQKKKLQEKTNSVRLSNKTGASETSNTRRFSSRISNWKKETRSEKGKIKINFNSNDVLKKEPAHLNLFIFVPFLTLISD